MSAPNTDKPGDGLLQQAANSVSNAAEFVNQKLQQGAAVGQKEGGEQAAKGNVGDGGISDRATGAKDAIAGKFKEEKHAGSAKANKEAI